MDYIINNFKDYKQKVPTYGAILLNPEMNQVLLVQGFGNSWGFPKGKVNQDEDVVICAIREVMEETGYDIAELLKANHYIESIARDRKERLYVVVGVELNFHFKPNTLYEIRQIAWFGLDELPENKRDNVVSTRGYNNSNFFTIYAYVRRLKKWIADKASGANQFERFRCASPTECQFPFPYPMGFKGLKQISSGEKTKFYDSPDQYLSKSDIQESFDEQENLSFSDKTPKNYIRNRSSEVHISMSTEVLPETRTFSSTARNPKRRLFPDDIEENNVSFNPTSSHSLDFFDGPGANAWLNFKLDTNKIISGFFSEF